MTEFTKKTIYIISTIIATVAIGGIVYLAWSKKAKTETKSTTEQKISSLQTQLDQIKQVLINFK